MDRLHFGIHKELEEAADELLRQAVAKLPRSQKMDILTPWKERDRLSREVYTSEGIPDPSVRSGIYHRAWNPQNVYLNSRDGQVRGDRCAETFAYFRESEEEYNRLAGEVLVRYIRSQAECRVLRGGSWARLQCVPCCRYLPTGDRVTCRKCGTVYVNEAVIYD